MDDDIVIKVEGLSKKFSQNLKRSMAYGFMDLVKNFMNIPTNQSRLRKSEFWALKDINFELRKGEILGVVGVNGSGKSTLLRVLTGIFPPDTGKVVVRGEIGALIAVGAGFHPHFTGRENIYLNGTVLGMSEEEIDEKFDDIVKFADIGDFLDSPVATYSSGMKVRLGFAVAISRVPEILLVDEVLAVGDISFRKKCLEKMEELRKQTSMIFISHNMYQVERICDRAILLDKGQVYKSGGTDEVIAEFYNLTAAKEQSDNPGITIFQSTGDISNLVYELLDTQGSVKNAFRFGEEIMIRLAFHSKIEASDPILGFQISSSDGVDVGGLKNNDDSAKDVQIKKGLNEFNIKLKNPVLLPGAYKTRFKFKTSNNTALIEGGGVGFTIIADPKLTTYDGLIKFDQEWA